MRKIISCGFGLVIALSGTLSGWAAPGDGDWLIVSERELITDVLDPFPPAMPMTAVNVPVIGQTENGFDVTVGWIRAEGAMRGDRPGVVGAFVPIENQRNDTFDGLNLPKDLFKADHFNWFQRVVEDTDPPGPGTPVHRLEAPYIDLPSNGYGGFLTFSPQEAIAADTLPWYFNEVAPAGIVADRVHLSVQAATAMDYLYFEDAPTILDLNAEVGGLGTIRFETYLVALNADGSLKQMLEGFSWEYRDGQIDSGTFAPLAAPDNPQAFFTGEHDDSFLGLDDFFEVINGGLNQLDFFNWSIDGPGEAAQQFRGIVEGVVDRFAELTSGSPITLSTTIDTPDEGLTLSFEHQFKTATGDLTIMLDGEVIAVLEAPAEADTQWRQSVVTIREGSALDQENVDLSFTLDGPSGSQIWLDNISLTVLAGLIPGDMDANGVLDAFDVDDFELALADRQAYLDSHPGIDPDVFGDMDGSGALDAFDVELFEVALATLSSIPEPAMSALMIAGGLLLIGRRTLFTPRPHPILLGDVRPVE